MSKFQKIQNDELEEDEIQSICSSTTTSSTAPVELDEEQGDESKSNNNQFKSRAWIFTLNNYTPKQVLLIKALECKYLVFGFEKAPTTGTPHLQGFVYWNSPKTKRATIKLLCEATVRCKSKSATFIQASNYCKGDYTTTRGKYKPLNDYFEKGELPKDQEDKKRSAAERYEEAYEQVCNNQFITDPIIRVQNWKSMVEYHKYITALHQPVETTIVQLRPWQQAIVDIVNAPVNNRTVHWIYDSVGNTGKSELCNYLELHFKAHIVMGGKFSDLAFEFPITPAPEIVVLDLTRTAVEHTPYTYIEQVKNGRLSSPKYQSVTKRFKSPHLFVFSNQIPDYTKLSQDRWNFIDISPQDHQHTEEKQEGLRVDAFFNH